MLPTLFGRIQSRIVFLAVIGGFFVLVLTPILPSGDGDPSIGRRYATTFLILLTVIVLGVLWEFLYHGIQQFRWEKDWPTLFGLLTMINEGLLVGLLLYLGLIPGIGDDHQPPVVSFIILFVVIWLAVWIWANGPMRIVNIHWRFRGGRLV